MLKEYLPTLPMKCLIAGKSPPPISQSLLDILKTGVLLRNEIVHGKRVKLNDERLRKTLGAVNDLLYYCDLLGGRIVASQRLSVEFSRYLSAEGEEKEGRYATRQLR